MFKKAVFTLLVIGLSLSLAVGTAFSFELNAGVNQVLDDQKFSVGTSGPHQFYYDSGTGKFVWSDGTNTFYTIEDKGAYAEFTFIGDILPGTDNTYDLGASGTEFKDLYIDGTANIDSLSADTADINAGTVDATIGGTTPAAGTFTSLTANTSFTSPGIDDNADAVGLTINSDEQFGFGETSPSILMQLANSEWLGFTDNAGTGTINFASGNSDDTTSIGCSLTILGATNFGLNPGLVNGIGYASVDSDSAAGTKHGIGYGQLDGTNGPLFQVESDGTGGVTDPTFTFSSQPAFSVTESAATTNFTTTSATTLSFDTERFDKGADFNTGTHTFTAPVDGSYQLSLHLVLEDVDSGATTYTVTIVTSNHSYASVLDPTQFAADVAQFPIDMAVLADMDEADTVYVTVEQSGGTAQTDISSESYFTGFLAY